MIKELVKINQAILRIPNLAIHLQTAKEREAFTVNKEDHLSPIIATAVKESLTTGDSDSDTKENSNNNDDDNNQVFALAPIRVGKERVIITYVSYVRCTAAPPKTNASLHSPPLQKHPPYSHRRDCRHG